MLREICEICVRKQYRVRKVKNLFLIVYEFSVR